MHDMHDMSNKEGSLQPGFEKLISILPDKAIDFNGTEFGRPVTVAYLGEKADMKSLRKQAEALRTSAPQQMCETAMVMAETNKVGSREVVELLRVS